MMRAGSGRLSMIWSETGKQILQSTRGYYGINAIEIHTRNSAVPSFIEDLYGSKAG